MKIDLNADLGESFGIYTFGHDDQLLEIVSSANIACGFHAGDFQTIPQTIKKAKKNHVAIGAHPGFPDLKGFGRRNLNFTKEEIYDMVLYQLGAFKGFARKEGMRIQHVKPHGALYNLANQNQEIADVIAQVVYEFDPDLRLYGLCNSKLIDAGRNAGLSVVREAFADRTYTDEGLLTPRSEEGAVLTNIEDVIQQVLMIVQNHGVISTSGKLISLEADSICIHGDTESAILFATEIKNALEQNNITIESWVKGD